MASRLVAGIAREAELLMSVVEKTPDTAKTIANEWKQAAIAKGSEQ